VSQNSARFKQAVNLIKIKQTAKQSKAKQQTDASSIAASDPHTHTHTCTHTHTHIYTHIYTHTQIDIHNPDFLIINNRVAACFELLLTTDIKVLQKKQKKAKSSSDIVRDVNFVIEAFLFN